MATTGRFSKGKEQGIQCLPLDKQEPEENQNQSQKAVRLRDAVSEPFGLNCDAYLKDCLAQARWNYLPSISNLPSR